MAYSTNPNLPKARAFALKMLILDELPLSVVANRCGVHRTTVWRWLCKWRQLNKNRQKVNYNRPSRKLGIKSRFGAALWCIPTIISQPKSHPNAITSDVVKLVLDVREKLNRCAEVVWHHLLHETGIIVSLSSIKRIFRRYHIYDRKTKRRRSYHVNIHRPVVSSPGDLVQTDTIHLVDPSTMKRVYIYTVIDLYTRMTYASIHSVIRPGIAAKVILRAETNFGFKFNMVQSDNGPEYSSYFEEQLHRKNIKTRHSRLHRPNDNAHIERFNRTIQEECTGNYWRRSVPLPRLQKEIQQYLDYYNTKRVHLGIQLQTPLEMLQRY